MKKAASKEVPWNSQKFRHCEERSDEAIQKNYHESLDCFVALKALLAMTGLGTLAMMSSAVFAVTHFERYEWQTPEQEIIFSEIANELRCVVCQNQSLADSYAPLAQDLKDKLYEQVLQNKNKEEIKKFFVARYGEFILYTPAWSWHTGLLWIFPLLLLIFGLWKMTSLFKIRLTEASE